MSVVGLELTADDSNSAILSLDGLYRFSLTRRWKPGGSIINFIMLNPSTADATTNDPTILRCMERAKRLGYHALVVTNLFAYRATNPERLLGLADPVGLGNDGYLLKHAVEAAMVICAWGKGGKLRDRASIVTRLLDMSLIDLHALRVGKNGEPEHPLYLPYTLIPSAYHRK